MNAHNYFAEHRDPKSRCVSGKVLPSQTKKLKGISNPGPHPLVWNPKPGKEIPWNFKPCNSDTNLGQVEGLFLDYLLAIIYAWSPKLLLWLYFSVYCFNTLRDHLSSVLPCARSNMDSQINDRRSKLYYCQFTSRLKKNKTQTTYMTCLVPQKIFKWKEVKTDISDRSHAPYLC